MTEGKTLAEYVITDTFETLKSIIDEAIDD